MSSVLLQSTESKLHLQGRMSVEVTGTERGRREQAEGGGMGEYQEARCGGRRKKKMKGREKPMKAKNTEIKTVMMSF